MVEDFGDIDLVALVADGDEDNGWAEDKSYKDDDEEGSEVDLSGDADAIDSDDDWRKVEDSGDIDLVALVADGYEDNG